MVRCSRCCGDDPFQRQSCDWPVCVSSRRATWRRRCVVLLLLWLDYLWIARVTPPCWLFSFVIWLDVSTRWAEKPKIGITPGIPAFLQPVLIERKQILNAINFVSLYKRRKTWGNNGNIEMADGISEHEDRNRFPSSFTRIDFLKPGREWNTIIL